MLLVKHPIKQEIIIPSLYTMFYYELAKDFISNKEQHDFWELVYVDKGELEIYSDNVRYLLPQGHIILYRPNTTHWGNTSRGLAPNIFIVTFECLSPMMDFFIENPTFKVSNAERNLLSLLIAEGYNAFGQDLLPAIFNTCSNSQGNPQVRSNPEPHPFGSEQKCKLYLEALLIDLIRSKENLDAAKKLASQSLQKQHDQLMSNIQAYILDQLHENLTIGHLVQAFAISRTRLSILFKKFTGYGVMEYVNTARTERAKLLIREEMYNISEISELLGYSSVHYFSRQFKRTTGMSPTEYARSIKAKWGN